MPIWTFPASHPTAVPPPPPLPHSPQEQPADAATNSSTAGSRSVVWYCCASMMYSSCTPQARTFLILYPTSWPHVLVPAFKTSRPHTSCPTALGISRAQHALIIHLGCCLAGLGRLAFPMCCSSTCTSIVHCLNKYLKATRSILKNPWENPCL
jgi:hypothetical protein